LSGGGVVGGGEGARKTQNHPLCGWRILFALQIKLLPSSIAIVQVTNSQEGRSGYGT